MAKQKTSSSKKVGRSKRTKDSNLSRFVRGKISAEAYFKAANVKIKK